MSESRNHASRLVSGETIQGIADLIAGEFKPERVILFGSYARGDATADSDVDLMVIMTDPGPFPDKIISISRLVHSRFDEPIDVFIRSPEVFAKGCGDRYSLSHRVSQEGKVLYEKASR